MLIVGISFYICLCASNVVANFQQRSDYLDAREKLRQGQTAEFRTLTRSLETYVLRPYLTYYDLRNRLSSASDREVLDFVDNNPQLPVADLLLNRWLRILGQRRQWQTLLEYYRPSANAELNCYYLRSLYGTGDTDSALDKTTDIWLQPVSQPKACDPLFDAWKSTSRFTENVVWQRFEGALQANERTLARYLIRYLSGSNKTAAEVYYAIHVTPSKIMRTAQFAPDTLQNRAIIAHGVRRLISQDPIKAAKAWRTYVKKHKFDDSTRTRLDSQLAVALASKEGQFPKANKRHEITQPDLIEEMANAAVEQQNWRETRYWISQLPTDIQQKSQWQYWLARASQALSVAPGETAEIFRTLAQQRHYYGFLAARQLGIPGKMNAATPQVSSTELLQVQRIPGITRSVELFAVGDDLNGRREWYAGLNTMTRKQQVLAAELARQLGLTSMSIQTANIAEASDHLHLRFPVVFEPQFRRASMRTTVPTHLLMAIARQESAMEATARSSADARGLMQLLPSTARLVARRARLPVPATNDLYDPGTNIALGSYHLAWLIQRYNNQAPLAIAAYNAGEHRVDRWIKDAAGMPMDVWIENIPFRETRNYVKNVLAFRHVYGTTLQTPTPLLEVYEQIVGSR